MFEDYVDYYYKMYESQLNDKIKYWQYHLKKNKKNEGKDTIKKTPEKKKVTTKSMYLTNSNNPNSIMNTIDKLKLILHQNQSSKSDNAKKQAKKMSIKDNDTKHKNSKSISMQGTIKLSKNLIEKIKMEASYNSKSKSKSKPKSKQKLIKQKKNKQSKALKQLKYEKQVKIQRKSPSKKTKKKKDRSPSPKKCYSIRLQSSLIRQQLQTVRVWPQTDNLKTEKSRFETESTHFRLWQQHEETLYNMKRKQTKALNSYFKSFHTFLMFNQILKKPLSSQRNNYTAFNLQNMIKSQQSKLLQLRNQLGKLKDSNNYNESLQIIISKVNENISSLKKIEYSQKDDISRSLQQGIRLVQVKSFHSSTRSVNQSQKSYASDMPEVRQPILIMDSLMISNDQISQVDHKAISSKEESNLKQQSSIYLLDSKFLNVTLTNPSLIEQNPQSSKKTNFSLLQSPQSMLLIFQSQQSTLISSNEVKSQSKLLSQISDDYQSCTPIFTVNQVKYYHIGEKSQEDSLSSEQFLSYDKSNQKLLYSINNILNDNAGRLQIQTNNFLKDKDTQQNYSSQYKSHVFSLILDDLIHEIVPFFGSHQYLLQKLIEVYTQSSDKSQLNIDQKIAPIQSKNQYLLSLTDRLLSYAAQKCNLFDRLKNPLGVQPFVNTRYIRISLIDEYGLQGFDPYNQQDYQQEIDRQMTAVQEKADILMRQQLDYFDELFGNQELPEQIIMNRCLYEAINNILDTFRPFGNNGLPIFYQYKAENQIPSLKIIMKKVKEQLQKYMALRLGIIFEQGKATLQNETQIRDSLVLHRKILRDQIEQDFKTQDQDSMQRYELMLMIENYIFSQESWILQHLFVKRQQICIYEDDLYRV